MDKETLIIITVAIAILGMLSFLERKPNEKSEEKKKTVRKTPIFIMVVIQNMSSFFNSKLRGLKTSFHHTNTVASLCSCPWLLKNSDVQESIYIFSKDQVLLITKNGISVKRKYQIMDGNLGLLIENNGVLEVFKFKIGRNTLLLSQVSSGAVQEFINYNGWRIENNEHNLGM